MDKDNVYIVTGDSGMGLTHGTIAGMLLTDLIFDRENPWSAIYDPTRKPIWGMAWKEFISENANVAKEITKDWLGGGDVSSIEDIPRGEGAILRRGMSKVAVYRDGRGTVHERSAVCPHLGLHCSLERRGEDMGLSLSRLPFRPEGSGHRRARPTHLWPRHEPDGVVIGDCIQPLREPPPPNLVDGDLGLFDDYFRPRWQAVCNLLSLGANRPASGAGRTRPIDISILWRRNGNQVQS